jgi:hypothetical protein
MAKIGTECTNQKLVKEGWGHGSSGKNTCLACARPWAQFLVMKKKV